MDQPVIQIRGARQHNLANIDLEIPRFKLVVITGVSGSGKSSLAFDTLYAEGQRRYVESLSAYARQFIGQMDKPQVDYIGGLSPAIAIEQKAVSKNPRSTVATVTEIYDYLRVLYARVGQPHCPQCGRLLKSQSAQEIVDAIGQLPEGTRFQILAPIVQNRKGTFEDVFSAAQARGFSRAIIDGEQVELSENPSLKKTIRHNIELIIDRLVIPADESRSEFMTRLTDSIETALDEADGLVHIQSQGQERIVYSEHNACPDCGISFPKLSPAMFSFNSPMGMCPECNGLGTKLDFEPSLFVDPEKTINEGGIRAWGELAKKKRSGTYSVAKQIVEHYGFTMDNRWNELSHECQDTILYGGLKIHWKSDREDSSWQGEWMSEGLIPSYRRRYHQTTSEGMRRYYGNFMSQTVCPTCGGHRLRPEILAVTVGGLSLPQLTSESIRDAHTWVTQVSVPPDEEGAVLDVESWQISQEVLKEIRERLEFLENVGLHYLTLDRPAPTLSGGEGQRIRLASQVGCGLVGVLYILDEPSIGLHQRDNQRLLATLERLRDMGNSVLVVEHDEDTMRHADWIIDMGPGAGILGGQVIAQGTPEQITAISESLTGQYLSGAKQVSSPTGQRRPTNGHWLTVTDACQNNLKHIDVRFPLGLFTCVTGVSGSGKSSLVAQTVYPALAQHLHNSEITVGKHGNLEGLEQLDKVINITQDPIGRTPRSNPATYVNVMGVIRELFAAMPEARMRGYKPGRFSFNVKGGRCEACEGHGQRRVEMHFLPDVWVTCSVCGSKRFNRETLQIHYKGKTIADVLDMDVNQALEFFENVPRANRILQTLADVGLGYIKLGQSATTLSGGEAQRVKLARELARVSTGDTVYILDEPTTGLHFADIQKLLDVLHRLTDAGNTVIVIEHNLDVIKTADWIIDLGPEGGDEGGNIIAQGTPEEVCEVEASYTGKFLHQVLHC